LIAGEVTPRAARTEINAAAPLRATAVVPHLMEEPMLKLSVYASLISLRDKWRRMLRTRRSLVELAVCPPGGLQRIAQDVGVSVSDLRIIAAAHSGPSGLLPLRLELLEVDPDMSGLRR
jgi:hypothetical protein